jgi:hypothetical protein
MNSMEDGRRNPASRPWTFKTREIQGLDPGLLMTVNTNSGVFYEFQGCCFYSWNYPTLFGTILWRRQVLFICVMKVSATTIHSGQLGYLASAKIHQLQRYTHPMVPWQLSPCLAVVFLFIVILPFALKVASSVSWKLLWIPKYYTPGVEVSLAVIKIFFLLLKQHAKCDTWKMKGSRFLPLKVLVYSFLLPNKVLKFWIQTV